MLILDLIRKLQILSFEHGNVEVVSLVECLGFDAPAELTEPKVCKIVPNEKFSLHSNKEPEEIAITNLQNFAGGRKAVYIIGG